MSSSCLAAAIFAKDYYLLSSPRECSGVVDWSLDQDAVGQYIVKANIQSVGGFLLHPVWFDQSSYGESRNTVDVDSYRGVIPCMFLRQGWLSFSSRTM